eukprot:gene1347-1948_t
MPQTGTYLLEGEVMTATGALVSTVKLEVLVLASPPQPPGYPAQPAAPPPPPPTPGTAVSLINTAIMFEGVTLEDSNDEDFIMAFKSSVAAAAAVDVTNVTIWETERGSSEHTTETLTASRQDYVLVNCSIQWYKTDHTGDKAQAFLDKLYFDPDSIFKGTEEFAGSSTFSFHLELFLWCLLLASTRIVFCFELRKAYQAENNQANTLNLGLPKNSLNVLESYQLLLTASLTANAAVTTQAKINFEVNLQELEVFIAGGDVLMGDTFPLRLDAERSEDPNSEDAVIDVSWQCTREDGLLCMDNNGLLLEMPIVGPSVNVTLMGSGEGIVYLWECSMTSIVPDVYTLTGTDTTKVTVKSGDLPSVYIYPPESLKPNANDKLTISAKVTSTEPESVKLNWEATCVTTGEAINLSEVASTQISQTALVIPEGTLTAGNTYQFKLNTLDSNGEAYGTLELATNTAPCCGLVIATPAEGVALETTFMLTAPNWSDDDEPLQYQFLYQVVGSDKEISLNNYKALTAPGYSLDAIIPEGGSPDESYQVRLIVRVKDAYGGIYSKYTVIVVNPAQAATAQAPTTTMTSTYIATSESALKNGDVDRTLQYITGSAALLNPSAESPPPPPADTAYVSGQMHFDTFNAADTSDEIEQEIVHMMSTILGIDEDRIVINSVVDYGTPPAPEVVDERLNEFSDDSYTPTEYTDYSLNRRQLRQEQDDVVGASYSIVISLPVTETAILQLHTAADTAHYRPEDIFITSTSSLISAAKVTSSNWRFRGFVRNSRGGSAEDELERQKQRCAMLQMLSEMWGMMPSSDATVERVVTATEEVVKTPEEIGADCMTTGVELLSNVVLSTQRSSGTATLNTVSMDSIVSSLSSLSYAAEISDQMTSEESANVADAALDVVLAVGKSAVDRMVPGETPIEVSGGQIALLAVRTDLGDPDSPVYAGPMRVQRPDLLIPHAVSIPQCLSTEIPTTADILVIASGTEIHPTTTATGSYSMSGVTTVSLKSTDGIPIERLCETDDEGMEIESPLDLLTVTLLQASAYAGPEIREGESATVPRPLCQAWDQASGQYSSNGCVGMPNPTPLGAQAFWRNRSETPPEGGLDARWGIGNATWLQGCVESYDTLDRDYQGTDHGLRKYIGDECALTKAHNAAGCWWDWPSQSFQGPFCVFNFTQLCLCVNLPGGVGDFTVYSTDTGVSMPSPEPIFMSTTDFATSGDTPWVATAITVALLATLLAFAVSNYLAFKSKLSLQMKVFRVGVLGFEHSDDLWTWDILSNESPLLSRDSCVGVYKARLMADSAWMVRRVRKTVDRLGLLERKLKVPEKKPTLEAPPVEPSPFQTLMTNTVALRAQQAASFETPEQKFGYKYNSHLGVGSLSLEATAGEKYLKPAYKEAARKISRPYEQTTATHQKDKYGYGYNLEVATGSSSLQFSSNLTSYPTPLTRNHDEVAPVFSNTNTVHSNNPLEHLSLIQLEWKTALSNNDGGFAFDMSSSNLEEFLPFLRTSPKKPDDKVDNPLEFEPVVEQDMQVEQMEDGEDNQAVKAVGPGKGIRHGPGPVMESYDLLEVEEIDLSKEVPRSGGVPLLENKGVHPKSIQQECLKNNERQSAASTTKIRLVKPSGAERRAQAMREALSKWFGGNRGKAEPEQGLLSSQESEQKLSSEQASEALLEELSIDLPRLNVVLPTGALMELHKVMEIQRLVPMWELESQRIRAHAAPWDYPVPGRDFEWYVSVFKQLASTIDDEGWLGRAALYKLAMLQSTDGSFSLSSDLATVLCAGEPILRPNITALAPYSVKMLTQSLPKWLLKKREKLWTDHGLDAERLWASLLVQEYLRLYSPGRWETAPGASSTRSCSVGILVDVYLMYAFIQHRDALGEEQETIKADAKAQVIAWQTRKAKNQGICYRRANDEQSRKAMKRWTIVRRSILKGVNPILLAGGADKNGDVEVVVVAHSMLLPPTPRQRAAPARDEAPPAPRAMLGILSFLVRQHPLVQIFIGHHGVRFDRSTRVLLLANAFILMLVLCLCFYYMHNSVCCHEFHDHLGCPESSQDSTCMGIEICADLAEARTSQLLPDELHADNWSCSVSPDTSDSGRVGIAAIIVAAVVLVQAVLARLFIHAQAAHSCFAYAAIVLGWLCIVCLLFVFNAEVHNIVDDDEGEMVLSTWAISLALDQFVKEILWIVMMQAVGAIMLWWLRTSQQREASNMNVVAWFEREVVKCLDQSYQAKEKRAMERFGYSEESSEDETSIVSTQCYKTNAPAAKTKAHAEGCHHQPPKSTAALEGATDHPSSSI